MNPILQCASLRNDLFHLFWDKKKSTEAQIRIELEFNQLVFIVDRATGVREQRNGTPYYERDLS